jgi:hypothetical protein
VHDNLVHDNAGAGVVISAEGEGAAVEDVRVHDNRIQDNLGTGVFIARFGKDGPRRRISIVHNQVRHNGWGPPNEDVSPLHWITGGLYLYSANVQQVDVVDNVFVDNRAFQLGCSADYVVDGELAPGFAEREIRIERNVAVPKLDPEHARVTTGWPLSSPDTIVPFGGSFSTRPARRANALRQIETGLAILDRAGLPPCRQSPGVKNPRNPRYGPGQSSVRSRRE